LSKCKVGQDSTKADPNLEVKLRKGSKSAKSILGDKVGGWLSLRRKKWQWGGEESRFLGFGRSGGVKKQDHAVHGCKKATMGGETKKGGGGRGGRAGP